MGAHPGTPAPDAGAAPGDRETLHGPSGPASVVLDIGPHAGALVVTTGPGLDGAEIEIRPDDGPWRGTHTAVRRRHVGGGVVCAGVFGSLPPGPFVVRVRGTAGPGHGVAVAAGAVTEVALGAHDVTLGAQHEATAVPGLAEARPGTAQ